MKITLLLTFLCFSFVVMAQDTLYKFEIGEVMKMPVAQQWREAKVSSASLSEEGLSTAPAMIRVITADQIRIRGYRSLLDIFIDMPDFKVDRASAYESYCNVGIRGTIYQNRFVILLDGVRISSPTNEAMPIFENYPVHYAKQVEIVYGSSSSLYGADAMTGVINIITKDHDKQKASFDANLQAGNYNFYNASLWFSRRLGNFSVSAAANFYADQQADLSKFYDDLDVSHYQDKSFNTIFGKMTPKKPITPRYETPLLAYSIWANIKNKEFSFNIFHNANRASSSYGNNPQNIVYNNDVFYGHRISMANAKYSKSLGKILLNTLIMGSSYEIDPNSNFRNTYTNMEHGYKYAYSMQSKLQEDMIWQINPQWQLIAGLTVDSYFSSPKTTDLAEPINPNNGFSGNYIGTNIPIKFFQVKYLNYGSFGQIRYHSDKFTVNLGGRFDYNTRFKETFNPRFAFNFHPNRDITFKILFGSAFLAPSPFDNFQNYGSFVPNEDTGYKSFFMHLPNPNLKPILSQNLELYFRKNILQGLSLELSLYHTWLSNLIVYASDAQTLNLYDGKFLGYPVDFIEIPINQDKQRNYGGTIGLDWRKRFEKGKINVYGTLSYVDGTTEEKINNQNKEVEAPMLTNWQLKTGLDLEIGKFSFSPRLIWVGKQKLTPLQENSTSREYLDGYQLLNISLRYVFYKESAFLLTIDNSLDRRYRTVSPNVALNSAYFLAGIPQQPLRFQIGLQLKL